MTDEVSVVELGVVAESISPAVASISFAPVSVAAGTSRHLSAGIRFVRLLLLFANADDPNYRAIGGHLDIVVADLGGPDFGDRLWQSLTDLHYPDHAEFYADLVGDVERFATVLIAARAERTATRIVLVLGMTIDQCFRGHDFGLALLSEMHNILNDLATVFISRCGPEAPAALVGYWQDQLGVVRGDNDLLILPRGAILPRSSAIIAMCRDQGYLDIDADRLRARWANGDQTLFPVSDGRDLVNDSEPVGLDQSTVARAAEAAEIALVANRYQDDTVRAEIVTALRFFVCTGADGAQCSEVFARAAEYLEAHPSLSVMSTNWRIEPCDCVSGSHLTLEIVVRRRNSDRIVGNA